MKLRKILAIAMLFVTAALIAPSIIVAAPGGGPGEPMMITGNWQALAPKSSVWFYFDYTGDRSKIEATLENYGMPNVQMAIFTPEQAKNWQAEPTTKPVGIGTEPSDASAMGIYDLSWRGAFNFPGRFFVVVTNNNANAISFRLNVKGDAVLLSPPPTPTPVPTPFMYTPPPAATIQGKLVFQDASGGDIYTVNGDGSNLKRIVSGIDPAWSPDGKQIAFTRWGGQSGVLVMNADGSNERALVGGMNQPLSPQFSPDGKRIVFTRQTGGTLSDQQICFGPFCFTVPAAPRWKLGMVNLANNDFDDVRSTNFAFAPSFNPDNSTIAFSDAQFGVMGTNITGSEPWNLYKQNPAVQSTRTSPDGNKIAFAVKQHDHWEIIVTNSDGGNPVAVTTANPLAFRAINNVAPIWSPDSKQVLFISDRNGKWEFFIANADGSNVLQVLKSVTDNITIHFNFSNERMIDWTK